MTDLSAFRVPAGRLARLGVVLEADERAATVARLCDRAGIDIIWLADRMALPDGAWPNPPAAIVQAIGGELERAALGLFVAGFHVEVGPDIELACPVDAREDVGPKNDARRSAVLRDLAEIPRALAAADDIVLPAWRFDDLETAADEVRAEAIEAGRPIDGLGVAALIPVSIGRTQAEAEARVEADQLFARTGHPADVGIFGTLEECQDRVIALAHAGITDLRCLLPATLDVHDVIAQLTAITIGTTDVLIPGSLRSPAPPPPDGWGGRPPSSDRPRVSDGSRRR